MSITRTIVATVLLGCIVMVNDVGAQPYPNKPVRIVTQDVGGGTDFAARPIARGLTERLGQPVIVDNRGGIVSVEIVAQAPPEGYSLVLTGGAFWITPLLQKTSYDPVKDFSPITIVDSAPQILVVPASSPAKSVRELIDLAKSKPGALNYSSGANGGGSHLAAELFKYMAGVNIVRVAYKGGGPSVNALVAGEVQVSCAAVSGALPHIKGGRLRALGVTSAKPSTLLPGTPPIAATLPGYEFIAPDVILAPAKTPAVVVRRLNQEIVRVINTPDVKEKFFNTGVEVVGNSPEEFKTFMEADMTRLGKLIKDAGIKGD